ncbi:hypothetical protein GGX14DRAFT_403501 [Mycena pura]|uniref:Uncharacterized protein n=1 Tax=Mycena pura TaxID=153505 RepID=A0AAD6UY21_9AGAR|nr:hypothetical protein GGX14DRAFT_403501 [Mycena pura]
MDSDKGEPTPQPSSDGGNSLTSGPHTSSEGPQPTAHIPTRDPSPPPPASVPQPTAVEESRRTRAPCGRYNGKRAAGVERWDLRDHAAGRKRGVGGIGEAAGDAGSERRATTGGRGGKLARQGRASDRSNKRLAAVDDAPGGQGVFRDAGRERLLAWDRRRILRDARTLREAGNGERRLAASGRRKWAAESSERREANGGKRAAGAAGGVDADGACRRGWREAATGSGQAVSGERRVTGSKWGGVATGNSGRRAAGGERGVSGAGSGRCGRVRRAAGGERVAIPNLVGIRGFQAKAFVAYSTTFYSNGLWPFRGRNLFWPCLVGIKILLNYYSLFPTRKNTLRVVVRRPPNIWGAYTGFRTSGTTAVSTRTPSPSLARLYQDPRQRGVTSFRLSSLPSMYEVADKRKSAFSEAAPDAVFAVAAVLCCGRCLTQRSRQSADFGRMLGAMLSMRLGVAVAALTRARRRGRCKSPFFNPPNGLTTVSQHPGTLSPPFSIALLDPAKHSNIFVFQLTIADDYKLNGSNLGCERRAPAPGRHTIRELSAPAGMNRCRVVNSRETGHLQAQLGTVVHRCDQDLLLCARGLRFFIVDLVPLPVETNEHSYSTNFNDSLVIFQTFLNSLHLSYSGPDELMDVDQTGPFTAGLAVYVSEQRQGTHSSAQPAEAVDAVSPAATGSFKLAVTRCNTRTVFRTELKSHSHLRWYRIPVGGFQRRPMCDKQAGWWGITMLRKKLEKRVRTSKGVRAGQAVTKDTILLNSLGLFDNVKSADERFLDTAKQVGPVLPFMAPLATIH